ncbi:MAG: hypothetical protein AAF658_19415, partial [Myxococcota bacterium]
MTTQILDALGNEQARFESTAGVEEGVLASLSLAGLTAGFHTLVVEAVDRAGNRTRVEQPLSVGIASLAVSATPVFFSPNADGQADSASLAITGDAANDLDLRVQTGLGGVTRTLRSGPFEGDSIVVVWNGLTDAGFVAEDSVYTVTAVATRGAALAIQETTVVLDATAPRVVIDALSDGDVVALPLAIQGSFSDENFASASIRSDGRALASLGAPRDGVLAVLSGLTDGPVSLEFVAEDRALNSTRLERAVVIDSTAPLVELTNPTAGAFVSGLRPTSIAWSTREENPDRWEVTVQSSGTFRVVASGSGAPPSGALADLSGLPSDDATLSVEVVDRAGQVGRDARTVQVDALDPVAEIVTPRAAASVRDGAPIEWTVSDANLDRFELELTSDVAIPGVRIAEGDASSSAFVSSVPAETNEGVVFLRLEA